MPNGIADQRAGAGVSRNANIDLDAPFRTPFPSREAGLESGIGGNATESRRSRVRGADIQGRDIDLFGAQQELCERLRKKYSNRVE